MKNADIDALLIELSRIAEACDKYEYGLPLWALKEGPDEYHVAKKMREAVRSFMARVAAGDSGEG